MKIANFLRKYTKSVSKSLFLKFFLAYTVVSLVMVILIGSYTRFYILKNLDNEIERFERKKINETLSTMDVLFGEMKKVSISQAINTKSLHFAYLPRNMAVERQSEVKIIQELLANTMNSSNYIKSIVIYYERNNYVLDYGSLMDLPSYYDKDWYEQYTHMKSPFTILDTRKVRGRSSNESSTTYDNIVTFMTKIPYSNDSREGAIILNVDERIISDLLRNITKGDNRALAFIVNDQGTVLSSNNSGYLYGNLSEILGTPQAKVNNIAGSFKLTYNGTKMLSYYDTFGTNNWKLFYVVSENTMFRKSVNMRNITVITLAVLLLAMTALSLLFSFKLYDPIKRIINSIKKMSVVSDDSISDVSMIQGEIKTLLENNQSLEKQLGDNKILVREAFLNQLIKGKLFNKAEIQSKAEYFSFKLDYDYFKVAIVQLDSFYSYEMDMHTTEFNKVTLVNMVERVFGNLNIEVNCTQDSNDNILLLMKLNAVEDINEKEAMIEQTLEDIQYTLFEFLNLSVSIGIGRMQTNVSDIGVSCKEAIDALQYKFLKGDSPVISYTDIAGDQAETLYYPLEMEQKLIMLINLGDYDKTIQLLNEMLDKILDYNKSFQNIEVCLSNIAGIVQRCIFELNYNIKDVFNENDYLNIPIDSFKNIQQFNEWISHKFRKVIEYHMDQQKGNAKSLVSDIKGYIDENYTKEISLVSVASHFNYNSSYLCKTFKEKTGISFWEYVSKIRIEKSKTLLSDTNKSIEQIAEMVGYNNRFSYIRTFKKYVAFTPGEYRTKHSAKQA